MRLAVRVIAAWAFGLLVAGGIAGYGYGDAFWDGMEWAGVLAVYSSPMMAIGCVACWLASARIDARPVLWTLGAVAGCWMLSVPLLGAAAVLSFTVSVPAAAAFLLSVWRWPIYAPAKDRADSKHPAGCSASYNDPST